jgi:hypothetical protein
MDIQEILSDQNLKVKPNIRVIDKENGEFSLVNRLVGANKAVVVASENMEMGVLPFSCFVDSMEKIPRNRWITIELDWKDETPEEKETKPSGVMPYKSGKDGEGKVYDRSCHEGGLLKIGYSKGKVLMDKYTAAFLENAFPKNTRRYCGNGDVWIEEIIFLEDNKDNKNTPHQNEQKQKLRKKAMELVQYLE